MLKKTVNYTDFDGNEQSETLYFHLSKSTIIQLELQDGTSFKEKLETMVKSKNVKQMMLTFKDIIGTAYGHRYNDGKSFEQTPEIKKAFLDSAAYDALFVELATSETAATAFFNAILPADVLADVQATEAALDVDISAPVVTSMPIMPTPLPAPPVNMVPEAFRHGPNRPAHIPQATPLPPQNY